MVLELVGRVKDFAEEPVSSKEFDEDAHPRDEHGRFAGSETFNEATLSVGSVTIPDPFYVTHTDNPAPDPFKEPVMGENIRSAMAILAEIPVGATERGINLDADGNIHADVIGEEPSPEAIARGVLGSVAFKADQIPYGGVLIHSHPTEWGQSDQDVVVAGKFGAAASIVVHGDTAWVIRPKYTDDQGRPDWRMDKLQKDGPYASSAAGAQTTAWAYRTNYEAPKGPTPPDDKANQHFAEAFAKNLADTGYLIYEKKHVGASPKDFLPTSKAPRAEKEGRTITVREWGWSADPKERKADMERLRKELGISTKEREYERDERGRFAGDGEIRIVEPAPPPGKHTGFFQRDKPPKEPSRKHTHGWGKTAQTHDHPHDYEHTHERKERSGIMSLVDRLRRRDSAGQKAVDRLQQQARIRSILYDQKLWDDLRTHATSAAMPVFAELYMGGVEAGLRLARHRGHKEREYVRDDAGRFAETEGEAAPEAPSPIRYFGYDKPTIKGLPVIGKQGRVRAYETTTDLSKHAEIMEALVAADPEFRVTKDIVLDAPSTGWLGTSSWYSPEEDAFLSHKGNDHVDMAWSMFGGHSQDDGVWERSRNPVGGADSPGRDGALAQIIGNGWVRVVGTTEQVGLEATSNAGIRAAATAIARTNPDIKVFTDLSTPMGIRASVDPVPYGKTATEVAHGTTLGPVGRARQDDSMYDPEAYNAKAFKDEGPTSLDQQIAQRALIDRVRLVNEWWSNIENSAQKQLAALLGPAHHPEGAFNVAEVIDGVTALFGPERAERIAVTETTRVMGQAAIATYELLGVDEWEWRTAEDGRVCPECEDMRDGGPYWVTDVFEPAHPRCRCWPVPLPAGMKEFAEKEAGHTGAMVALFPSAALAKKLALPGGEPAADLHVTLAFLGKAADIDGDAVIAAVKRAVQEYGPMKGEISGVGRFSIPDGDAFYASVDLPDLPSFRQGLLAALDTEKAPADKKHGFSPHMTLAYIDADEEIPLDRMEPVPVTFDSVVVALGDERTHIMFGSKDFDEDSHPRDDRGRFAGLDEHEAESHRAMGRWGSHEARPLDKLHHGRDPKLTHKHTKFGALITSNNNVVGSPLASLVGRRDWDEDDHPRDEAGRFADSDSGYLGGTMDQSVGYDGPPPGSKAALEAAAKEYPWLKDPTKVPTVSEFSGAKTVVDTPEIIAERLQVPQQSIDISQEQAERMAAEMKAEQDGGIKQEREAHIVLGIPASAKSKLVASPLAEEIGARLCDPDIAKEIVANDLGYTQGRVEGADGYAGVVHEASSTITRAYIEDSIERGDNIVIPKVGDNYEKMADQIKVLKDNGYTVKVQFVDVKPEEGMRRNAARYYTTGRFVDPLNTLERTDSKPEATYERLKANGLADGFKRIDNNGGPGEHFVVEDIGSVGAKAEGGAPQAPLSGLHGGGASGRDDVQRLKDFDEDKHPRDEHGRFSGAGTLSEPLASFEVDALRDYQTASYHQINGFLRGTKVDRYDEEYNSALEVERAVQELDSALAKSTINEDMVLYRGITGELGKQLANGEDALQVGTIITDKGFISTSTNKNSAMSFGVDGVLAKISVSAGSRGLELADLPKVNNREIHSAEKEVLLPRGSSFRVTKVGKEVESQRIMGHTYRMVELEAIP